MMWFLQFITGITFKWDYVLWSIINLLMWIIIWIEIIIYRVPPDLVKWHFQGFGYLWKAFMMIWMLPSKKYLNKYHRKQVNSPSDVSMAISLAEFECKQYGIFEGT